MTPSSLVLPIFWYIYLQLFLVTTLNSLLFVPNTSAHALANDTDHLALLKFKESISNDPYGILDSWNSSTHFCSWHGITCSPVDQRVTKLKLSGYQLHGSISPQLGNLSFLRSIQLKNNSFHGSIPQELHRLSRLQELYLNNNSLTGEIPVNLTSCSLLEVIDFSWNNLIGKIPLEIGALWKLKQVSIVSGNLTGQIPPSIEYGIGAKVSIEGDMYSFGVLILEMLTGRRPTNEMFKDGHNLRNYAKSSIPNNLLQVVDHSILPKELQEATSNENLGLMYPYVMKCLFSLFKIALACSMESPKERMTMVDVMMELNLIKSCFPSIRRGGK